MKTFLRKCSSGTVQATGVTLIAVLLSACGADKPVDVSSSSSSSSSSPSSSSSSSSSSGSSADPLVVTDHDHCVTGFHPQVLTDITMDESYATYTENGQTDTTVQPEVIEWMEANQWQEAHFVWHEARRCGGFSFGGGQKSVDPCNFPEMLPPQNECAGPQDGYEFLAMHRHMIEALKQLWPNHQEQFQGWDKFPGREDYPELLRQYYKNWDNSVVQNAAIADDINNMTRQQVLDRWPTEGHFGQWLQCGSFQGNGSGLHGALHFNGYPANNQAHSVANQKRNLDAYQFWKLHGWIDHVWEDYRTAVGLTPDEPKLRQEIVAQCQEMHFWAGKIDPTLVVKEDTVDGTIGTGVFHDQVRPALESAGCATCHGAGEEAGLRLGYNISSEDIVSRLVNVDARNVEGYKLVVPGDPDKSWLYLKASGASESTNATCRASAINSCKQRMPGNGMGGMSGQQLTTLRNWILDLQ